MIFSWAYLTLSIFSSILIRSVYLDRYPFPPFINQPSEYVENAVEDEVNYVPLSDPNELPEYDWSPPDGQLPDTNYKIGGPLSFASSLSGDDDDDGIQDFGVQWIGENKRAVDSGDDAPKSELRRGFDFPKKKKNQVLCRVQKAIHHHAEAGHEFFPKSFTSYSCHPVSPSQMEGTLATGHDTCYVAGEKCITIEKEQLFLKRRLNTNCWTHFIEAVGAGCKCLSRKY